MGGQIGDAPPQEVDKVEKFRKTSHMMVFRGLFPSLLTKKMAETNLVIAVVFLVAFGLCG